MHGSQPFPEPDDTQASVDGDEIVAAGSLGATRLPELTLNFHGRVIDHLGIQMYQSPTAALSELIANAWDADAKRVELSVPPDPGSGAEIDVRDDGVGMTLEQCQERFLNVGYDRREGSPTARSPGGRLVLGRKGIGKFAGFGIALTIQVDTVSETTGEHTVFELDLPSLRNPAEPYIGTTPTPVKVISYEGPDAARSTHHGTTVRLQKLKLGRAIPLDQLRNSMSRRFTLYKRADDFTILVNDVALSYDDGAAHVEFIFPRDYTPEERPAGLTLDSDWGLETLADGNDIAWQFVFYKKPINDEDLTGVAIYSDGKLVQSPFFFNLHGGLGGQHGQSYLSGQVDADYLDQAPEDIISTERQRVDWNSPIADALLAWGQQRILHLLRIWQDRRAHAKLEALETRMAPVKDRIAKLQPAEGKVVRRVIASLAKLSSIQDDQFEAVAQSMLTAWETGRLREVMKDIEQFADFSEADFIKVLMEADVLSALQIAESVKARMLVVKGLRERVEGRHLENKIRDYVAEHPQLISAKWQTFAIERRITYLLEGAQRRGGMLDEVIFNGRVDLVLSSGEQLLVLEFMRPGLRVDWEHLSRFERYIMILREELRANPVPRFTSVTGYLIADRLSEDPAAISKIQALASDRMFAMQWEALLRSNEVEWEEYLAHVVDRSPPDERLQSLAAREAAGEAT